MLTIELFGISRTGKTSTLRNLASHFEANGERCEIIGRAPIDFKSCRDLEDFHQKMLLYLEQRIPEAQERKPHYLLMDRGPYDRQVMLEADHQDGKVGDQVYRDATQRLLSLEPKIDIPLIFLVDPTTSLARIGSQRDEGLDYSHMCVGLNTRDNVAELGRLFDQYSALQRAKKGIISVYTGGSATDTLQSALRVIASTKVKNNGEHTQS
ncbi:MAG: hypothetical protein AABX23_04475 [Nanoarchaeota archaeon]